MKRIDCSAVQELLPEWTAGSLDRARAEAVDLHVATCQACAAEASLVAPRRKVRAEPPLELEARIRAVLAQTSKPAGHFSASGERPRFRFSTPAWAAGLAATLVLGVGSALLLDRNGAPVEDESWLVWFEGAPSVYVADDGMVAGAPVLEDLSGLSDDQVAILLEELEG